MIGSAADNRPYEDSHQRRIGTAGVIHKSALSKIVAERLGISQVAAVEAAAPVVESIEQALSVNDRVTLTRFAIFSAGQEAARLLRAIAGDNVGQIIDAASCNFVGLKAGNTLKQTVRYGHQLLAMAAAYALPRLSDYSAIAANDRHSISSQTSVVRMLQQKTPNPCINGAARAR